ncbi:MAG: flagellar hook protein FlgE, partial [Armatimonadota bacterium]|nr:flagellar hook protein FlgE [Armatimonadota bacterium]
NGVSAIEAHQQRMDVIGNNIANVNTTAYKAGRVTFQDQLSQTIQGASKGDGANIGGTNPQQTGLGVKVGSIDTLMGQGGLQATSRPTDLAIQGNGFFMLGTPSGTSYTRDGSFTVDSTGNLVNASTGQYVLGWQSDPSTGALDTTKEIDGNSHLNIPVGSLTSVFPTSATAFAGNLSAEATSTDPAYSRSVKVYDSLGAAQNVTLGFQRDASLPAGAPTNATSSWTWTASGTGVSTPASTTNQGTVFFDNSGKEISSTGSISIGHTDGSSTPQAITPSFNDMIQVSGASNAAPASQNGTGPGTLQSFSIDETGSITGIFNNGQTRTLGQLALATFANPEGLQRAGANDYQATVNTGLPQIGTATQSGLGKISSGYLEQSNVDLSNEFTNMIITQRGFQANTKIVTTVDQMLNELINIKQ